MSDESVDIDGYCARIGYSGPREPTLASLRAIVAGHTAAIPFENLDVLAKRRIRLDPPSLYDKLVRHRRGGYCYEHNLLLLGLLHGLGYRAAGLAARVHRSRPPGVLPPRSHMLLRVDLTEGPYIADVGFGTAVTAPLALEAWREQASPTSPSASFRLATNSICRSGSAKRGPISTACRCTSRCRSITRPRTGSPRPIRSRCSCAIWSPRGPRRVAATRCSTISSPSVIATGGPSVALFEMRVSSARFSTATLALPRPIRPRSRPSRHSPRSAPPIPISSITSEVGCGEPRGWASIQVEMKNRQLLLPSATDPFIFPGGSRGPLFRHTSS